MLKRAIKFARKFSGGASREAVLAAAAWSTCSVGMTLVNKLAVTATRAPMGVVLIQMATTAAAAALTCNVHLGDGWQRWALTVPALFIGHRKYELVRVRCERHGEEDERQ